MQQMYVVYIPQEKAVAHPTDELFLPAGIYESHPVCPHPGDNQAVHDVSHSGDLHQRGHQVVVSSARGSGIRSDSRWISFDLSPMRAISNAEGNGQRPVPWNSTLISCSDPL